MSNRLRDIQSNLEKINYRIAAACASSRRNVSEITLIAVTKTYPASDVDLLKQLGIENVGENKDQEASGKISQVKEKFSWHFIGQLQSNKAKSVVTYADLIHSVDRLSLAKELQKSASAIAKKQKVLIQVDLDQSGPDASRGGVWPADLAELAQFISQSENLGLAGLMSVAPLGENPSEAFQRLAQIRSDFLKNYPNAVTLSAGMSEDLEAAIEHGATHLRIGSALLGERPKIG
jgi:pyridoxal phosphate enzyme (YggS family)